VYTTKDHVFIHLNKNAGVFIKDFRKEYLDATVHKYKHGPIRMLDHKHRQKIKIGAIRDPFDWYRSYYTYHQDNGRFLGMSFEKYIRTYANHPRALLSLMGKRLMRKFPSLYPPRTTLPIGAYTFHYINYFTFDAINIFKNWNMEELKIHIKNISCLDETLRVEHLREDMIKVFRMENEITNFKKRNVSQKPKKELWTEDLKDIVWERDGFLAEALGYGR
jgi:hypothetical protein